jgi:hypothetical protein
MSLFVLLIDRTREHLIGATPARRRELEVGTRIASTRRVCQLVENGGRCEKRTVSYLEDRMNVVAFCHSFLRRQAMREQYHDQYPDQYPAQYERNLHQERRYQDRGGGSLPNSGKAQGQSLPNSQPGRHSGKGDSHHHHHSHKEKKEDGTLAESCTIS